MDAFGIYNDAPQMPFVIPNYIFQPIRPFWRPLWSTASGFLHWMWSFVLYLFEDDGVRVAKDAGASHTVVGTVTETTVSSGFEGDWSMMNDEIL
jgi:hypothetical protein